MKLKNNVLSIAMLTSLMSGAVCADVTTVSGGTVHFTGSLVDAACSVSIDSADQNVELGQYRTAFFKAVGDTSASIPFNIILEDCDTTVSQNASVAFSGQRNGANDALLAVVSHQNKVTAGNVGIQILDEKSKPIIPDGSTFSTPHALIDGENIIPFTARYMSTADKTTAGEANADAVFTMQYN